MYIAHHYWICPNETRFVITCYVVSTQCAVAIDQGLKIKLQKNLRPSIPKSTLKNNCMKLLEQSRVHKLQITLYGFTINQMYLGFFGYNKL